MLMITGPTDQLQIQKVFLVLYCGHVLRHQEKNIKDPQNCNNRTFLFVSVYVFVYLMNFCSFTLIVACSAFTAPDRTCSYRIMV